MADLRVHKTKTDAVTVTAGDVQADVAVWANLEGVTFTLTGKHGAMLASGSARFEEVEALSAALALVKA